MDTFMGLCGNIFRLCFTRLAKKTEQKALEVIKGRWKHNCGYLTYKDSIISFRYFLK